MDLSDERFHRRIIPWTSLVQDGIDPQRVMLEAQKRRLWKIARSARHRLENEKQGYVG